MTSEWITPHNLGVTREYRAQFLVLNSVQKLQHHTELGAEKSSNILRAIFFYSDEIEGKCCADAGRQTKNQLRS